MAKYTPGPLGPLKGKIGNMVASNWRDIYYLKAKAKRSTVKTTEKKKKAQLGFGFVSSWLTPLHKFLLMGFKDYHPSWDGRISAQSYNRKHALVETEDGFDIDYKEARFCYGELPGAEEINVSLKDEGTLLISWNGKVQGPADGTDALIYILASPKLKHLFVTGIERSRKDGNIEIRIPPSMRVGQLHVQIAFKSLLNEMVSISQYAGSVDFGGSDKRSLIVSDTVEFCQSPGISGSLIKRINASEFNTNDHLPGV